MQSAAGKVSEKHGKRLEYLMALATTDLTAVKGHQLHCATNCVSQQMP